MECLGPYPALERARKLQKKAARAGFDWTETALVIAKLREELDEFEEALSEGDSDRAASELGDVFSAVNLARHQKTEPETVLRQASKIRGQVQMDRNTA